MSEGRHVGFDFDGCLCRSDGTLIEESAAVLREVAERGDLPIIVTSRTPGHELPSWWSINEPGRVCVWPFVERHELPVHGVIFCSHQRKLSFLFRMGIADHYDNDRRIVSECNESSGSTTRGHLLGDLVG